MMKKTHAFPVLNLNPFPFMCSISVFNLIFDLLIFIKSGNFHIYLGVAQISVLSFLWWSTYHKEIGLLGGGSDSLNLCLKLAITLFISSEVLFFFSFFWSYYHYYFNPSLEMGENWPPQGLLFFDCTSLPLVNTIILLFSGLTVTLSHKYMVSGDSYLSGTFLLLTSLLGGLFLAFQSAEYSSAFFTISDSNFGSSFFLLTGFHGLHVLLGTIFLFAVYYFYNYMHSSKNSMLSFHFAAWYWHFVDVVWLFLYFSLYYLNN